MRRTVLRTAAAAAVVLAALWGRGASPVRAAAGVTFTDASGDVLDPILTQDRLAAVPSTAPRPYADITRVSATPNGTNSVSFSVTTVEPMPVFPVTNGDTGVLITACFDIPGNEAIANGPVRIGTGHHGEPVYWGPFNSRDGWKACAWEQVSAGGLANSVDWGVALWDPIGYYVLWDRNQVDVPCTLCFPYVWTFHVPPPQPPLQGIPRTDTAEFLGVGDVVHNLTVATAAEPETTPSTDLCAAAPCGRIGPVPGVVVSPKLVDWAPGRQLCSTAVVSCTNDDGGSGFGNGYDLGLMPRPGAGAVPDCGTPNLNASCPVITGTVTYDECYPGPGTNSTQDTGDLYATNPSACLLTPLPVPWPYAYAAVNGRTLLPDTPEYTPDGAGFTA